MRFKNEDRMVELQKQLNALRAENRTLRLLHGELSADDQSWLQMKVASQRKALDRLNRTVVSQRFRLRVLQSMGRDLTKDEYLAAKDAIENEQVKERVDDYAALV